MAKPLSQWHGSFLLHAINQLAQFTLNFGRNIAPTHVPTATLITLSARTYAGYRARETLLEPDPLFRDNLAAALAGPEALQRALNVAPVIPRIAIRTRYFDDYITRTLPSLSPTAQLVFLGAGMDARVYRLDVLSEDMTVFEVDDPVVLEEKCAVLQVLETNGDMYPTPRCALQRVAANPTSSRVWHGLREAGFRTDRKTLWVLESIVYYLLPDQLVRLFCGIHDVSPKGSRVIFSAINHPIHRDRNPESTRSMSSLFRSVMPQPEEFLNGCGFSTESVDVLTGPNANFGRCPPDRLMGSEDWRTKDAAIYVAANVI